MGDEGDWPEVGERSEVTWRAAQGRLEAAQVRLVEVVMQLKPEALQAETPGCKWTNYTMIHGTLHHDLYHARQISLWRRQLA